MIRTIEAVVDTDGRIQLSEPLRPGSRRRAFVVILDEPGIDDATATLSEQALQDWNRPEGGVAWSHLRSAR